MTAAWMTVRLPDWETNTGLDPEKIGSDALWLMGK